MTSFSVEDYVRDYEFRGEGGDYKPTEDMQEMLVDAIYGALNERENVKAVMMGPCCICGDTGYAPSMGGPSICPKCDSGNFDAATVAKQAQNIRLLRQKIDNRDFLLDQYRNLVAQMKTPSDGRIYASVSRRDALKQVLAFLESIEGAGYGGMAEFEIARSTVRHEIEGPLGLSGQDFLTRLLVATDPHLQPIITEEMVEAGAKAIAPEVWATDPATFGHPESLNRRGHEHCKSKIRAQAAGCLEAALAMTKDEIASATSLIG